MGVVEKSQSRRMKGRHRRTRRNPEAYMHWLGAGAMTLGLGAAMATGRGIAAVTVSPVHRM